MLQGIPFSPVINLAAPITATSTTIQITTGDTVFPAGPNRATITDGVNFETISYTERFATRLTGVQRGIEGEPRSWGEDAFISRVFTNTDYVEMINAIGNRSPLLVHFTQGTSSSTLPSTTMPGPIPAVLQDIRNNLRWLVERFNLSGHANRATTADRFTNGRNINGVNFDGSQNITITAAPTTHTHDFTNINGSVNLSQIEAAPTATILGNPQGIGTATPSWLSTANVRGLLGFGTNPTLTEAQEGTANAARVWSALRVRQAADAAIADSTTITRFETGTFTPILYVHHWPGSDITIIPMRNPNCTYTLIGNRCYFQIVLGTSPIDAYNHREGVILIGGLPFAINQNELLIFNATFAAAPTQITHFRTRPNAVASDLMAVNSQTTNINDFNNSVVSSPENTLRTATDFRISGSYRILG